MFPCSCSSLFPFFPCSCWSPVPLVRLGSPCSPVPLISVVPLVPLVPLLSLFPCYPSSPCFPCSPILLFPLFPCSPVPLVTMFPLFSLFPLFSRSSVPLFPVPLVTTYITRLVNVVLSNVKKKGTSGNLGGSFRDIAYRLALIIQIKISTLSWGDFGAISVTEQADRASGTSHIG